MTFLFRFFFHLQWESMGEFCACLCPKDSLVVSGVSYAKTSIGAYLEELGSIARHSRARLSYI